MKRKTIRIIAVILLLITIVLWIIGIKSPYVLVPLFIVEMLLFLISFLKGMRNFIIFEIEDDETE